MIHTNLPWVCVVFLLLCELTPSAIYGPSKKIDSHKWRPWFLVDEVQWKPRNFEWIIIHVFYFLKYLSYHMHFITNGYKHFLKTNSSDPRQRVPLTEFHWPNASYWGLVNIRSKRSCWLVHCLKTWHINHCRCPREIFAGDSVPHLGD